MSDDDIIERGSDRAPRPGWRPPGLPALRWRPPRIAVILCAAGLIAGLAVGYAVGHAAGHAGRSAPPALPPSASALSVPPSASALSVPPVTDIGPPLGFNGSRCSQQTGHDLQLGVEVSNDAPALLTIVRVDALALLHGLQQVSWAWGPCGELPGALPPDHGLATGQSTWLTVTLRVLVSCPGPQPVQLNIQYILRSPQDSYAARTILAAFPDLSQVPYSGCQ